MIGTTNSDGIAIIAPDGSYTQGELHDALERVLSLRPDGPASCLILDFTHALLMHTLSIVRRRELARDIASHAARYSRRVAIVVHSDEDAHLLDPAVAVLAEQGIESRVCRDLSAARAWAERGGMHSNILS